MEKHEILAMAIIEAFEDKEDDCLQTLKEFYQELERKGYSRDLLYRDSLDSRRFINLRYWKSLEARDAAHDDPTIHKYWRKLGEICHIEAVYERLEPVI